MTEQEKFEAIIKAPPYEHTCEKHTDKTLRPSEYSNYETLLAWHIWEECAAQKQAEIDALRNKIELLEEDIEAFHLSMDKYKVPRENNGNTYSMFGRALKFKEQDK